MAANPDDVRAPQFEAPLPRVCIVMPAYMADQTVALAAESVLDQDYPNLILGIAVRKTDVGTLGAALGINDPRVKVLEQTDKGIADARNLILRNLDADLFMFLDADDLMKPGTVSAYVRHRIQTSVPGLRFGHYSEKQLDDPRPEWVRRTPFLGKVSNAFERLSLLNFIGPGAVMIDREILTRVGYFDTRFHHAEDWHFWLRIAREFPLFGLDVVAYRYTYGKISLATPYPRSFFDDGIRVINDVRPPPIIKLTSHMCVRAMYALYYFRTLRNRRTIDQLLDIRIKDLLCLPPAGVIRFLRGRGVV